MTKFVTTLIGCFAVAASFNQTLEGAIQTKTIEYQAGNIKAKGFLAWDDAIQGARPGVLVVHEWWGLNDYAKQRAEMLAKEGYVALACDMYGDGKLASHPKEAGEMAGLVRANQGEWRNRASAALTLLKAQPQCDSKRLAAIGYCFGGSTALQLAYSGADLGVVGVFHGSLPTPTEAEAKSIKGTILVCHGSLDSFVSPESIQAFSTALNSAGTDWEMDYYSQTKHSFTDPEADKHGIPGIAYNKAADQRSWQRLLGLMKEKWGK